MQEQSLQFIVLAYTKIKENTIVVHTLSDNYGRKSFIASINKTCKISLFAPLSLIEANISHCPKSSMQRLKDITCVDYLLGIRGNIYKSSISIFMAEVLYRLIRDEDSDSIFFQACWQNILHLDRLQDNYMNLHLWFLLDLAKHLGFAANPTSLQGFVAPQFTLELAKSITEVLSLKLSGSQRSQLSSQLLKYIEAHSGCPLNIKSLEVLQEVFAS